MSKDYNQFTNEQEVLLSVGPFGGLDITTSPYHVSPNTAVASSNVVPYRTYKAYCTAKGRTNYWNYGYISESGGTYAAPSALIMLPNSYVMNGTTYTYNALIAWVPPYLGTNSGQFVMVFPNATGLSPTAYEYQTTSTSVLTQYSRGNFILGNDGFVYPNLLTDSQPQVLPSRPSNAGGGFTSEAYSWGVVAPTTYPVANATGSGPLNGGYYYATTNISRYATGGTTVVLESSPSPFTGVINATNQNIALSTIPVSSNPGAYAKGIYRFGGSLGGVPLLVATILNAVTTYTDTTADVNLTGQELILHNDPAPPNGITACAAHKGRMWIITPAISQFDPTYNANTASAVNVAPELWYSNYGAYQQFNDVSQVLSLGSSFGNAASDAYTGLGQDASTNIPINLLSVQSILLVLMQGYYKIVYGDTPADFLVRDGSSAGCQFKTSCAVGYGLAFWLGSSGVQMCDGNTGQAVNISDFGTQGGTSIRSFLDTYMAQSFKVTTPTPVGFCASRCYFLSFPAFQGDQSGTAAVTYGFDIEQQIWFSLPYAASAVTYNTEPAYSQDLSNHTSLAIGKAPGVLGASTITGTIDQWFAAETDYGNPIVSSWTTNVSDSGDTAKTKQYRFWTLNAPNQPGSTCTLTFNVNPGSGLTYTTGTIDLGTGSNRHVGSIPSYMNGEEIQVTINVTSSAKTVIDRVTVQGYFKRNLVQPG